MRSCACTPYTRLKEYGLGGYLDTNIMYGRILAGMLLLLSACSPSSDGPIYETDTVERGTISDIIPARGNVEASELAHVSTEVSGRIDHLAVDVEAFVEQGQLLASFDRASFQARLQRAQSALDVQQASCVEARARLDRIEYELEISRELVRRGAAAEGRVTHLEFDLTAHQASLASCEAQIEVARSEVQQARLDIQRIDIRAPISGFILERHINEGDVVNAVQSSPVLFTIAADLDVVLIRAQVAERDVGRLDGVEYVRFSVDAYPTHDFIADLVRIERAPIQRGRFVFYPVVLIAENQDDMLLPGMTAAVEFVRVEQNNKLIMPIDALYFTPRDYEPVLDEDLMQEVSSILAQFEPDERRAYLEGVEIGDLFRRGLRRAFVLGPDGPERRLLRVEAEDQTHVAIYDSEINPGEQVIVRQREPR